LLSDSNWEPSGSLFLRHWLRCFPIHAW
jgi:hypothetical protein